jgi:hypothetical protein
MPLPGCVLRWHSAAESPHCRLSVVRRMSACVLYAKNVTKLARVLPRIYVHEVSSDFGTQRRLNKNDCF